MSVKSVSLALMHSAVAGPHEQAFEHARVSSKPDALAATTCVVGNAAGQVASDPTVMHCERAPVGGKHTSPPVQPVVEGAVAEQTEMLAVTGFILLDVTLAVQEAPGAGPGVMVT